MVNFGTSVEASIPPSAKQVVLEASASSALHEVRRQRIQRLREAIDGGQYRVSAGELADAILRASRQAN
jgi:flagellar biosynthesis anti-sigma factor FlgM